MVQIVLTSVNTLIYLTKRTDIKATESIHFIWSSLRQGRQCSSVALFVIFAKNNFTS